MSELPSLRVLYEDPRLVAVDKPSGLVVHRGWAPDRDTVIDRARAQLGGFVAPLHRLDRGTSGVLLLARDPATASALGAAFTAGAVAKTYLALVRGRPPAAGRIDHPLPRREGGERVPARTEYRTLVTSPVARCSLVEARPVTGRPHQIRRHLKHISHPLVGDVRWGKGDVNREFRERFGLHRLALHAVRVCVRWRGEELVLESPPAPELISAWEALGCWPLPEAGRPGYGPDA